MARHAGFYGLSGSTGHEDGSLRARPTRNEEPDDDGPDERVRCRDADDRRVEAAEIVERDRLRDPRGARHGRRRNG